MVRTHNGAASSSVVLAPGEPAPANKVAFDDVDCFGTAYLREFQRAQYGVPDPGMPINTRRLIYGT